MSLRTAKLYVAAIIKVSRDTSVAAAPTKAAINKWKVIWNSAVLQMERRLEPHTLPGKAFHGRTPYILASAQRLLILVEVLLGLAIDWQVVQVLK